MVTGFIIENQTTKERVTMGMNPKFDYVYKENGLDWGFAPATHSTYFYPGQVGEKINMTNITGREIMITGYVHYIPTEGERSAYNKSDWVVLKENLHGLFSMVAQEKKTMSIFVCLQLTFIVLILCFIKL